jgi:hypothetical protein
MILFIKAPVRISHLSEHPSNIYKCLFVFVCTTYKISNVIYIFEKKKKQVSFYIYKLVDLIEQPCMANKELKKKYKQVFNVIKKSKT